MCAFILREDPQTDSHVTVKSRLTILSAASVLWQFEDEKDTLKQSMANLKKQSDDQEEAVKRTKAKLEEERKSHDEDLKRVAGEMSEEKKVEEDLRAQLKEAGRDLEAEKERNAQASAKTADELASLKASLDKLSELKPQLQEALAGKQSLDSALKSKEAEVAKSQGKIESLDKEMSELKKEVSALKEQLADAAKADSDQVAKLRAEKEAADKEIDGLKKEVSDLQENVSDDSVSLVKAAPKRATRAAPPPPPSPSTPAAAGGPAMDLTRCKQLTRLIKDCIDQDHFVQHQKITDGGKKGLDMGKAKSTVGISFETLKCEITGVLPGGPADGTKKIAVGDTLISINGELCKGNEGKMDKMLLGDDTAGSITVLGVQSKQTGQVEFAHL